MEARAELHEQIADFSAPQAGSGKPEILLTHACPDPTLVLNIAAYLRARHFSTRIHHLVTPAGTTLAPPEDPADAAEVLLILLTHDTVPPGAPAAASGDTPAALATPQVRHAIDSFRAHHGQATTRIGIFPLIGPDHTLPSRDAHPHLADLPLVSPDDLAAFVRRHRPNKEKQ